MLAWEVVADVIRPAEDHPDFRHASGEARLLLLARLAAHALILGAGEILIDRSGSSDRIADEHDAGVGCREVRVGDIAGSQGSAESEGDGEMVPMAANVF
jgi:hypothetical protein